MCENIDLKQNGSGLPGGSDAPDWIKGYIYIREQLPIGDFEFSIGVFRIQDIPNLQSQKHQSPKENYQLVIYHQIVIFAFSSLLFAYI